MSSPETETRLIRYKQNNDFRFRIWLKMHHSAQKISNIFSDRVRAAGTIFCTPPLHTFQMKVTPLNTVPFYMIKNFRLRCDAMISVISLLTLLPFSDV